ncbi:sigma 54-interacting transcriptional regulator [Paludibaculum fermentans]|uniref:Sigma 54-interacting transcriptional regulator n=1 Tax=Paludibaculum fermentans TaxID=1473598 RepID=A0A7S7NSE0_PALFE|nr:sigma 54-interacting transcriptional regulator [Paludibaculum fermentans]QOY88966.1 sigma 54-interacting transcriptional regulator [Paludibaculum fermentans]
MKPHLHIEPAGSLQSRPEPQAVLSPWLVENGLRELQSLFRAVVFHPSSPILIADDDRNYQEASVGAGKLFGLQRENIIGRRLDDFLAPSVSSLLQERWQQFLKDGDQVGTLQLLRPDGSSYDVEYRARGNVLPVRHLLLLKDKLPSSGGAASAEEMPNWVQDYALCLLDADGHIVAWYGGAERMYGYRSEEVLGAGLAFFYPADDRQLVRMERKLLRAAREGHAASEAWHCRKDGSQFWANSVTMALRDEAGILQGYARVVRDFTDRHERDEALDIRRAELRTEADQSTIAGVASGEFERIAEMNDPLLEMLGYTREDLLAGRIVWASLTPKEYAAADEFAHEEGLRFGASSPFEKELLRKDGTRVSVRVATAVLKLSPFRWISFVTDLRSEPGAQVSLDSLVEKPQHNFPEIVGSSRVLKRVLAQVELVAPTDATVLVLGETGTGKEMIALALHRLSPRRNFPFVSVNCAAIPTGLLESELFGYEKGAFTGALQQKIGRFEMAHRGTLFLDEVGDIPLELQPKLLRALQEKCFERLGSTRTTPIDIRLVAATNQNLTQMVGDKLFRSDLYYRLKVFPVTLPALRERPEDIPLLARHFTKKYAERMGRRIDLISSATLAAMVDWPWPGNIRELENFIEKSVILSRGTSLRAPLAELRATTPLQTGSALEDVERDHIVRILRESGGVISVAARRLRIPRTTLNALMKRLHVSRTGL